MSKLLLCVVALASSCAAASSRAAIVPPDTRPGADKIWLQCTVSARQMSDNCRYVSAITDEKERLKAGSVLGYLDARPFPIPGGAVGADAFVLVRLNVSERPDHQGYVIAAPEDTSTPASGLEVSEPVWVDSPYDGWAKSFTPQQAAKSGVLGEAGAVCKASKSGALVDCWLEREDPTGWGFGTAALEVLTHARMKPQDARGEPVADRPIAITLKFNADGRYVPCLLDGKQRTCELP